MAFQIIDLDTLQPNGKPGDPARTAFLKVNNNFLDAQSQINALGTGVSGAATSQQLAAEATARQNADTALQQNINAKADTTTVNTLSSTVTAQGTAIGLRALTSDLNSEVTARQNGDSDLALRLIGNNLFINSNLDFWQRGRSRSGTGTGQFFGADRFIHGYTSCTHAVTALARNPGEGGAPVGARTAMVCQISGATASSAAWLGQKIERVDSAVGPCVLDMVANGDTATRKFGVRVIQVFGTGGSPSADVTTSYGTFTLSSTTPTRYRIPINLPSVAGKTIGADGNDCIYVVIDLVSSGYDGTVSGQNGQFTFQQIAFVPGPNTYGQLSFRHPAQELLLCERYCEKSYDVAVQPGTGNVAGYESFTIANAGYYLAGNPKYKTKKRAGGAVTIYRFSDGTTGQMSEYNTVGAIVAGRQAVVAVVGQNNFEVRIANGDGAAGNIVRYHWLVDAEI